MEHFIIRQLTQLLEVLEMDVLSESPRLVKTHPSLQGETKKHYTSQLPHSPSFAKTAIFLVYENSCFINKAILENNLKICFNDTIET